MSMLPKAARPFGTIISAVIKNGKTQMQQSGTELMQKSLFIITLPPVITMYNNEQNA